MLLLKDKQLKYLFIFFCISVIVGSVLLIVNYEVKELPIYILVFGYILLGIWGFLISLFILFFIVVLIFIILQCCCMEFCDSPSVTVSRENSMLEEEKLNI